MWRNFFDVAWLLNNERGYYLKCAVINDAGIYMMRKYLTMGFCLECRVCPASSSSSLFMTLVASERPEVPSDLSPVAVVDFDKRRGS